MEKLNKKRRELKWAREEEWITLKNWSALQLFVSGDIERYGEEGGEERRE